jgi:4-alpha-glucanotransferase
MPIDRSRKRAGMLVPVFALRRAGDLGIGDTACVREAIEFCADHGFSILQLLPINETGGDHSPYNAISSVALDPVYVTLDPAETPGLTEEMLAEHATPEIRARLNAGPVQYGEVKELKNRILAHAFAAFEQELAERTPLAGDFLAFIEREASWLSEYSLFRVLLNEHDHDAVWTRWPREHQTYEAAEQWLETHPDADDLHRFREFGAFMQWVAFRQWAAIKVYAEVSGVELMGDIPFGVSRYSADVWGNQHLFDLDWSGGAPPEPLFETDLFVKQWGQNWGIPLYIWDNHRQEDFAWWNRRIAKQSVSFHHFRIDHVLGFFRIYAFPWPPERNVEFLNLTLDEAEKLTGGFLPQFLPGPDDTAEERGVNKAQGSEMLRRILTAAGEVGVVAEDLGMVPPYVRPLLQEMGIPGFSIPIFERDEKTREFRKRTEFPTINLATYATHDHEPLAAYYARLCQWWHGPNGHEGWLEVQRLMRFLNLDDHRPPTEFTPALHRAFVLALAETPCWLMVLMISDLLGNTQRFNQPGSAAETNWSQRLPAPLAVLAAQPEHAAQLATITAILRQTHRSP